ncbi:HemK2/MTQ2 family protein methyltransferase [Streptomyces sp. NPDC049954]|uniref:HemK2/MTQ2 family protein methyltransferase n=1 Tax=Streptomyces sp. NPDC049954 TaxID=3155779 RepID=UPI00341C6FD2
MTALITNATTGGRLLRLPGVYAPQSDTRLLLLALERELPPGARPRDLLDIGTGSGVLAVHAARLGARVTAVDIAWRAVLSARANALLSGQRLTVRRHDAVAALTARSYDLLISNPPYVPAPTPGPPTKGAARAWDAGHDGRAVLDHLCALAPAALRSGGVLLLVHSALCGTDTTVRRLTEAGLRTSVSDRARIPFGPVVRSRLGWLRSAGLLGPDEDREEVVVIRAERP